MASHRGLHVRLESRQPIALDVAFDCAPGELLAIVGPSGSGKTTILRTIAGLYTRAHGAVHVGDEAWLSAQAAWSTRDRHVGMVFQDYALFPHLTALENVGMALHELPRPGRDQRAREFLDQVHLAGLEGRLPRELSGGQKQRVAVARALAREPKVLLLDEPFSAVDQVTRRKLQRELAQLRKALDIPVVLVTHDLEEAGFLADRMVVISRGRTLQVGTPDELLTRPATREVAQLVEYRNVFLGEVVLRSGDVKLAWLGHTLDVASSVALPLRGEVLWGIAASGCVLHRVDRPSRGEHENPIPCRIHELVVMGDTVHLELTALDANGVASEARIFTSVNRHTAERNALNVGRDVKISLLAQSIHFLQE